MIKSTIKHDFLLDFLNHPEFLAIKLHTPQGPIVFSTAYIRPETNLPIGPFNKLFDLNHLPVFFAGDINANHTALHHPITNTHGRQLMSIFNTRNLHYIGPDFYTFITSRSKGRPDLIFGNRAAQTYHSHCSPGPNIGSDHIPMVVRLSTSPILVPNESTLRFSQANWEEYTQELSELNLDRDCDMEGKTLLDIDKTWTKIFHAVRRVMRKHVPSTSYKIRRSFQPSMRTIRLENCYRQRFQQNLNRLNQVQWDLTILKNHVIRSYAADRDQHWLDLIKTAEAKRITSPRDFWQHIRQLKGTNKDPFTHLVKNNQHVTEPKEVIKVFHEHWKNVFHPHPVHPTAQSNVNRVNRWFRRHQNETKPLPTIRLANLNETDELTAPITFDEVKDTALKLKKKASSFSEIGQEAIHHFPDNLLLGMTALFNASLATGYFPRHFKGALVVLILKPGKDPSDPKSYRPISLLEIIGKIFERILSTRLRRHLEDNSLLTSKQFGFRPHRSTQDTLNIMTAYLRNNADRRLKSVLVTKDVEQAFDTVWHIGLKYKICTKFNLPSLFQRLLCNFLDDRKLSLKFLDQRSDLISMHAGVPQGSGLSPTLYAMYTSDIPDPVHPQSLTMLYADDCTHLTRHVTLKGVVQRINAELNAASRWEHQWRIKTNPDKTKVLHVKPRRCNDRIDPVYINQFDLPRRPLQVVNQCKVLGLQFDRQLKFHFHAKNKAKVARAAFCVTNRFRNATIKTKQHLFQALVKPHLTYAPLALLSSAQTHRNTLQAIQSKALRWIHNVRWSDFISNQTLHQRSKISKVEEDWIFQLSKQIRKLGNWCNDWTERVERLAASGARSGLSINYLSQNHIDNLGN